MIEERVLNEAQKRLIDWEFRHEGSRSEEVRRRHRDIEEDIFMKYMLEEEFDPDMYMEESKKNRLKQFDEELNSFKRFIHKAVEISCGDPERERAVDIDLMNRYPEKYKHLFKEHQHKMEKYPEKYADLTDKAKEILSK